MSRLGGILLIGAKMSFKGKYVYYGNDEGGFCFGRIESEAKVNTVEGEKRVFILVNRMSCMGGKSDIMVHKGRSNLRVDKIDLKKDVFEKMQGLDTLTEEQLFLCMMSGGVDRDVVNDTIGRGVAMMLYREKGEDGFVGACKSELECRMGQGESRQGVS